jgi:hypothetical protein
MQVFAYGNRPFPKSFGGGWSKNGLMALDFGANAEDYDA